MILTCGDWFFNKMEKRTMQADNFDVADLGQDWIEPTPLLVGDLEKNGFVLDRGWTTPYFKKKLGRYDRNNKWEDIASIEISQTLDYVAVYVRDPLDKECGRGLGSLYNPKGLQVHELQQFLRLCGYADIADNFQL